MNGSGKSTIAKCLNGLLLPTSGSVYVDGMNTRDDDKLWDIRSRVGMVFQNPDNQIIALLLETRWWDLPMEVIQKHIALFKDNMTVDIARKLLEISKEVKHG